MNEYTFDEGSRLGRGSASGSMSERQGLVRAVDSTYSPSSLGALGVGN